MKRVTLLECWTEAEAHAHGIQYKHWKDPTVRDGDFIISDDRFIIRAKTVHTYIQEHRRILTDIGKFSVTKSGKLRVAGKRMFPVRSVWWKFRYRLVRNFIESGLKLREAYLLTLGREPTDQHLRDILKTQEFWTLVSKAFGSKLKQLNLDEDALLKEYRAMLDDKSIDPKLKFQVLNRMSTLNGGDMDPESAKSRSFVPMQFMPMVAETRQNFPLVGEEEPIAELTDGSKNGTGQNPSEQE